MNSFICLKAELTDIQEIVDLGAQFFKEAGWKEMDYDPVSATETISKLINNEDARILIVESIFEKKILGMAAVFCYSWYFNKNQRTAQELFWYVLPEYRSAGLGKLLLTSAEKFAKERGCQSVQMMGLAGTGINRIYEKYGYRPSEETFIKRLS